MYTHNQFPSSHISQKENNENFRHVLNLSVYYIILEKYLLLSKFNSQVFKQQEKVIELISRKGFFLFVIFFEVYIEKKYILLRS